MEHLHGGFSQGRKDGGTWVEGDDNDDNGDHNYCQLTDLLRDGPRQGGEDGVIKVDDGGLTVVD